MSKITYYNSFSAVNVKYFEFLPISEEFTPKKESICLTNGLKFNLYEVLSAAKDFTFNKKTGTFLSNFYKQDVIYNFPKINNTLNFTEINSPLTDINNNIISPSAKNFSITQRKIAYPADSLTFKKVDDVIFIINNESLYLTFDSETFNLTFEPKITPDSFTQKFEYILSDNSILLFPYSYNKDKILVASNPLTIQTFDNNTFYSNRSLYYFGLYSFKNKIQLKDPNNSFITEYVNNPIDNKESLKINEDEARKEYNQNFLLIYPYEYLVNEKYPLYIHGLKNYQTPEYNYSKGSKFYSKLPWTRREYDQIFTGTNQYNGYENVFLGYRSKTQKITFEKGKDNKFFYPITAPSTTIHDSGLVGDGARAGDIPYESDRLYIHNIDYLEYIHNRQLPVSGIDRFNGVWACCWLSGNSNGEEMWMDRYYNNAYYTLDQALSADTKLYNNKLIPNISNVWDVKSKITLEPGVRYSYYRIGDNDVKDYIQKISYDDILKEDARLLDINSWDSNVIVDNSDYKNKVSLYFNKEENLKGKYINLDGNNHAIFSTTRKLLNDDSFTANIWINVDDWSNIKGEQVFGNYYNSGYGLMNSSSASTPTFTISENASGKFLTFNYRFGKINTVELENLKNQKNKIIQKLPNLDYWVFDCKNLIGRKYDIEGNLLNATNNSALSSRIKQIDQVEIDANQNLYLYEAGRKRLAIVDSYGNFTISKILTGNSIQLNKNSVLLDCYGSVSAIDNNNNLWEIVGGNLYKNSNIYASIGKVQQMSFDSLNNLWLLYNQDTVSKLNTNTNRFEFTYRIGPRSSLDEDPCVLAALPTKFRTIDFLRVPSGNNTEDVAIIVDIYDNEIYILNQTGKMISKLNLKNIIKNNNVEFYAEGDFTGYQYLRKYSTNEKEFGWKFKIAKPDGSDPKYYNLKYPTTNLYRGWHQFTFVFDSYEGKAEYFIDSILVDSVNFNKNVYNLRFDYKASLLLGATMIKNKILNDIIKIQDGYKFVGKISDIKLFSKSLTQRQIKLLYHDFFDAQKIENLNWNIPTGERNFIECIDQWYKMQITGAKSPHFNIKLRNLNVNDELKPIIESSLQKAMSKIIPTYTNLNKIEWL